MSDSAFEQALKEAMKAAEGADRAPLLREAIDAWSEGDGQEALAGAWFSLGESLLSQDEIAEAVKAYQEAIELDPSKPDWGVALGMAYQYLGEHPASVAALDRVIEAAPTTRHAYYNRGNAWFYQGKLEPAIADYTRAIEVDGEDKDAWFNRGVARMQRIEGGSGSIGVQTVEGGAAYGPATEIDEAVADYTRSLEIDPEFTRALVNRGLVYRKTGREELAIADLRKAAELGDPNGRAALKGLFGITLEGEGSG